MAISWGRPSRTGMGTSRSASGSHWTRPIPSTNRVEARYMIPGAPSGAAPVEASVNHVVPGARIQLSMDEGKPGDSVTVTGDGFKAFASIEYVRVGGIEVTPAPRPATDRNGEFTVTVRVPGPDRRHSFRRGSGRWRHGQRQLQGS